MAGNYTANIKWRLGDTVDATPWMTGTGAVSLTLYTDKFTFTAAGGLIMPSLPTADPVVAGQIYSDAGTLKVSAGP